MARPQGDLAKSNKHRPMTKPRLPAFKRKRGAPAWASSKVLQQNRKRARLVALGLAGLSKEEMREIGTKAAKHPRKPADRQTGE